MIRLISQLGIFAALIVTILGFAGQGFSDEHHYEFQVREATTAINIAKAAFEQEFGKAELNKLKYFEASRERDHWLVLGHPYRRGEMPSHGGSFDFTIAVKGGCVLNIWVEM